MFYGNRNCQKATEDAAGSLGQPACPIAGKSAGLAQRYFCNERFLRGVGRRGVVLLSERCLRTTRLGVLELKSYCPEDHVCNTLCVTSYQQRPLP